MGERDCRAIVRELAPDSAGFCGREGCTVQSDRFPVAGRRAGGLSRSSSVSWPPAETPRGQHDHWSHCLSSHFWGAASLLKQDASEAWATSETLFISLLSQKTETKAQHAPGDLLLSPRPLKTSCLAWSLALKNLFIAPPASRPLKSCMCHLHGGPFLGARGRLAQQNCFPCLTASWVCPPTRPRAVWPTLEVTNPTDP